MFNPVAVEQVCKPDLTWYCEGVQVIVRDFNSCLPHQGLQVFQNVFMRSMRNYLMDLPADLSPDQACFFKNLMFKVTMVTVAESAHHMCEVHVKERGDLFLQAFRDGKIGIKSDTELEDALRVFCAEHVFNEKTMNVDRWTLRIFEDQAAHDAV